MTPRIELSGLGSGITFKSSGDTSSTLTFSDSNEILINNNHLDYAKLNSQNTFENNNIFNSAVEFYDDVEFSFSMILNDVDIFLHGSVLYDTIFSTGTTGQYLTPTPDGLLWTSDDYIKPSGVFINKFGLSDTVVASPIDKNWYLLSEYGTYTQLDNIVSEEGFYNYAIYDLATTSWELYQYTNKGVYKGTITKDSILPTNISPGDWWDCITNTVFPDTNIPDQMVYTLDNITWWNGSSYIAISINLTVGKTKIIYNGDHFESIDVSKRISENYAIVGGFGGIQEEREIVDFITDSAPDVAQFQPGGSQTLFNVGPSLGGTLTIPTFKVKKVDVDQNAIDTIYPVVDPNAGHLFYLESIEIFSDRSNHSSHIETFILSGGFNTTFDNLFEIEYQYTDMTNGTSRLLNSGGNMNGMLLTNGLNLKLKKNAPLWTRGIFYVVVKGFTLIV
jgi:hypothetical protein